MLESRALRYAAFISSAVSILLCGFCSFLSFTPCARQKPPKSTHSPALKRRFSARRAISSQLLGMQNFIFIHKVYLSRVLRRRGTFFCISQKYFSGPPADNKRNFGPQRPTFIIWWHISDYTYTYYARTPLGAAAAQIPAHSWRRPRAANFLPPPRSTAA
jgi:hypothetical protein